MQKTGEGVQAYCKKKPKTLNRKIQRNNKIGNSDGDNNLNTSEQIAFEGEVNIERQIIHKIFYRSIRFE